MVTKSIPANSIACGVPAKVIGTVEESYEKYKDKVDRTVRMSAYEKRCYVQQNREKYENWRLRK